MQNVTIALNNRPGALAEMGDALAQANISIEGGGAWATPGQGIGQFLFADGEAARSALEAAGIHVVAVREVVTQRLNQQEPGQLGKLCRRMAEAGINIEVQYSDHDHQRILVVDNIEAARTVSKAWAERESRSGG